MNQLPQVCQHRLRKRRGLLDISIHSRIHSFFQDGTLLRLQPSTAHKPTEADARWRQKSTILRLRATSVHWEEIPRASVRLSTLLATPYVCLVRLFGLKGLCCAPVKATTERAWRRGPTIASLRREGQLLLVHRSAALVER